MKKIIITALFVSTGFAVFAQGFYLRLGIGYAMPEAGQTLDGTGTPYNGSQSNPTTTSTYPQNYNIKSASFSSGVQGALGLGYMFTQHVGVQLDAALGLSTKKYTYDDQNVNIGGTYADISIINQAKSPFIVTPSIVLQTGGDPWNIYTRLGFAIPLSTKISEDQVVTYGAGTTGYEIDDYTFQVKNSFSLGFAAAAGVQYKLNDKVSLFGEVSLLSMSVFIKQSTLTALNVTTAAGGSQGVPLSNVSGPMVVNYSKKASVDSAGDQQPTYSQPFSNVGFNFGVVFKLGNQNRSRGNEDIDQSKPYRRH